MTFILVNDLSTNENFVLQFSGCNISSIFAKCVDHLKQEYAIENLYHTVNHDSMSCEVYKHNKVLKRGWVWNSTENIHNALFTLKLINCQSTPKYSDASTQTDNLIDFNFYDNLLEDEDENGDDTDNVSDILKQFSSDFTVGTGYANTMFFPNSFTLELQEKLSLPNNGLKFTNYNVM